MVDEQFCTIDDFGPLPIHYAWSACELGELVRRAASNGQAVYPVAGRTMLGLGLPPTKQGFAVDLRGLDQVIDYPARDMTITVQAGITLAELNKLLLTEGQQLPIDVPQPERATLGGALATNASGPRRYGYGTLRDYVIGMTVINDEGHETKAGGRVVKNVAGYDLCKLHIGALGTLGVITQVTLKLKPLPEARAIVLAPVDLRTRKCQPDFPGIVLESLHESRVRPTCVDLLNAKAMERLRNSLDLPALESSRARWKDWLFIGFEGSKAAVAWQVQEFTEVLENLAIYSPEVKTHVGESSLPIWHALTEFSYAPDAVLTFKANVLPRELCSFCITADYLAGADPNVAVRLQAHAGNGIVIGHVSGDVTKESAQTMLDSLLNAAAAAGGNVVLLRCPPKWKRDLPVWGRPRDDRWLMRAVKDKLDPRGIFNPGRFVDGI